ncbi:MAG: ABC transporter ATP-binding protein [Balneolaceae bacterium]|nr:ABC transporter ATP-binding protein [Balneolaceae bacterium]
MVTIENLSFSFTKYEKLFNGLSMKLETGYIYGLFGMNGAGKTTLLNHISGMLFPDEGICSVSGELSRNRLPETLQQLYVLPEQFDLPSISAEAYMAIHAPFYPLFDDERFQNVLNEFDVDPKKKLPQLSYGQRKKFLIAFALTTNAKLLLMDEPTNGLDIPSKSQFRKVMAASDLTDRCVVISTHQVRDLDALIDHITVLNNGKIIFQQNIASISETLSFEKIADDDNRFTLYSEDIFGGKSAILPKSLSNRETQIDLELLFSAVIHQTDSINSQFEKEA